MCRVGTCTMLTAAVIRPMLSELLPEHITPTHWLADLIWIALLHLKLNSTLPAASGFDRQLHWSAQVGSLYQPVLRDVHKSIVYECCVQIEEYDVMHL